MRMLAPTLAWITFSTGGAAAAGPAHADADQLQGPPDPRGEIGGVLGQQANDR